MINQNSQRSDEKALITQAKDGNADAFGMLYEIHAGEIYQFLYAHLTNVNDAEDITLDVFIHTWQALPTYDDRGLPFRAFLFKVARNKLIDHFRQVKHTHPLNEEMMDVNRPNPEEETLQSAERKKMRNILGQLHKDYEQVLILRFFSGLNAQEIARIMARSEAAIRVLQFRALQSMKKLLADEGVDENK